MSTQTFDDSEHPRATSEHRAERGALDASTAQPRMRDGKFAAKPVAEASGGLDALSATTGPDTREVRVQNIDGMTRTSYLDDDGKDHSVDDLPAVEWSDGTREWRRHGELHRENGPAIEYPNGGYRWMKDGSGHRIDGPALSTPDGSRSWVVDGKDVPPPTPVRTVDLRTDDVRAADLVGYQAMVNDISGGPYVATIEAPNPFTGHLPVLRLEGGSWTRANHEIEIVDWPPTRRHPQGTSPGNATGFVGPEARTTTAQEV